MHVCPGIVTHDLATRLNKLLKMKNENYLWLTWETQQRNISLSRAFNAEYFEVSSNHPRVVKYFVNIVKTYRKLRSSRPRVVFAQNPSLVLSCFAVVYCRLTGTVCILDVHNAGIWPVEGQSRLLNGIAGFVNRYANMILVSNDALRDFTASRGCHSFTLPDPVPELQSERADSNDRFHTEGLFSVLFVCTWASDEPYREVLQMQGLDTDTKIFISGKYGKKLDEAEVNKLPENFVLTGFISKQDYVSLLSRVDVVMVLTTRENCLVCGAYEAVSQHKPIILSDTEALRNYFFKGTVFTKHTPGDLARSIDTIKSDYSRYSREIQELKPALEEKWTESFRNILQEIDELER